jgi:hypothetical protein
VVTLWGHIAAELGRRGWNQRELEKRIGKDGKFLVYWIKTLGNETSNTLSASVSRRLGSVLGTSAGYWRDLHLSLKGVPKRQLGLEMEGNPGC